MSNKVQIGPLIPESLYVQIKVFCARNKISISSFARMAFEYYLSNPKLHKFNKNVQNRTIKTMEEIMRQAKNDHFSLQISKSDLTKIIAKTAGGDKRTIRKYINLLLQFGYIKLANKKVFDIITHSIVQNN